MTDEAYEIIRNMYNATMWGSDEDVRDYIYDLLKILHKNYTVQNGRLIYSDSFK